MIHVFDGVGAFELAEMVDEGGYSYVYVSIVRFECRVEIFVCVARHGGPFIDWVNYNIKWQLQIVGEGALLFCIECDIVIGMSGYVYILTNPSFRDNWVKNWKEFETGRCKIEGI